MKSKLSVRVAITPSTKSLLPWTTVARRGRQTVESQLFALLGYHEGELATLTPAQREVARDYLEFFLRLLTGLEYIPKNPEEADGFFEKKLIQLEERLRSAPQPPLPLHGAVGIVQETRTLFATSGDILALHVTPTSVTNLGDTSSRASLHFETFHAGILNARAYLVFLPKYMGTLLKSGELKAAATQNISEGKLDYFEHIWKKRMPPEEIFRAVVLETKPKLAKATQTTAVSISHLLDTEAKTEALLSPPLLKPLLQGIQSSGRAWLHTLTGLIHRLNVRQKVQQVQPPEEKELPRPLPDAPPLPWFAKLSVWSNHISRQSSQKLKASLRALPGRFCKTIKLPNGAKLLDRSIARFNALPLKSKLLFLLVLTFLFVFAESVLVTLQNKNIGRAEAAIGEESKAIRTLIDNANAALIYNDETKAASQLEEALKKLTSFPQFQRETVRRFGLGSLRQIQNRPDALTLSEFNTELSKLRERLAHVITIAGPTPVDPNGPEIPKLADEPATAAVYQKRRYSLSSAENQVFRHEPTAAGFDAGTPWIKDGTDVRSATAIAVDGSIYLGYQNGNVTQLLKGGRTNFTVRAVDPALENIKKLWTDEHSDFLYALDPTAKRLLVFAKKDGALVAQYKSPSFNALKDFAVDETKKLAYLLDDATILSFPLSHFR